MADFENELIQAAYDQYTALIDARTQFDLSFFISLHRNTFKTLYEWAGEIRTQDMVKGGSRFCQAAYLPKELDKLFKHLENEHYLKTSAGSVERFAQRIAHYQCELIALHPFYEINGRITRLFFDLIALANGYNPIDYQSALLPSRKPNDYIQASIECVQQAESIQLFRIILNGLTKQ